MPNILPYIQVKNSLSLVEKVGQLFMPAAFINDTEEEIQRLEKLIKEQHIGSLCFFHSRASAATNFEGKKKVVSNEQSFDTLKNLIVRYQKAAKYPLLIAIDAEWGLAMRIENTPQYPYAITLGAMSNNSDSLIYEVGKNIAKDCKSAGIHWNLAPCVDINNNPNNPVIGYRSFGEDKIKVTQKALAYINGTRSEGVLTSIKHFPGHGDTATDSHLGLPVITKTKKDLEDNELYPFQKLILENVDSVMAGHLSVPALASGADTPSSISKDIIKGVLRTEMGYHGVVISDALNMHAVSKNYPTKGDLEWLAFNAGNDVLCFAEHIKEGSDTILKNASEAQIEESFKRIWELKEKAISSNKTPQDLTIPDELNQKIAEQSLTLMQGTANTIAEFQKSEFKGLAITSNTENQFFKSIYKNKMFAILTDETEITENDEDILFALFPPQIKPTNNFGFTTEELAFINQLIKTKNVILYVFGNPYVLNHINIENAKAVIIAYQNQKSFQEVAANHFLGNLEARGKLPITI
ncbi:glycoside hydrolase family 3 protein [Zobellia amurskyensis]|uniref:beta-N-acetylhexosaminidase n=1 Tax=Zobellia amurskyensis TaxID=248905 RepID=A0A7X3D3H4_9FLAO|nr:glycoside hydrolase family 3 N-terminal domain-containing protein [Zobellia amurskyensis]MUH37623.1 glycoside hydrolase family 3 protein [Zobellia amurskyensis]